MSLRPRLAAFALIFATTAACSSQPGTPTAESESATTTSAAETTTVSDRYTATSETLQGVRGTATYDITIPQIEGSDPAVVSEFNDSVRSYVDDQIDQEGTFTLTGTSQMAIIGEDVIAGVLKMEFMSTEPMGAHPYGLVGTWVIRKSNAQPVMLEELFSNEQDGLERLSQETGEILTEKYGDSPFESGYAPEAKNFANWVPTEEGLTIHFDDGQVAPHAAGMVVVDIPWSALDGVLAEELY